MPDEIHVYVVNDPSRANLRLKYIDPITGVQHWKSAKTGDPELAIKAAGVWQKELNEGMRSRANGRLSWSEFIKTITEQKLPGMAPRSQKLYVQILNSVTEHAHPATIGSLSPQLIAKWQTGMREAGTAEATIESRSSALKAMLNWAENQNYIAQCPKFPAIVRSRTGKKAKGRPLSEEEFQRMLDAVEPVISAKFVKASRVADMVKEWHRSLTGLWLSGLRIQEAIDLSWTEHDKPFVDLSEVPPVLKIWGDGEKGKEDRILPLAPEFGQWLLDTPEAERVGPVFRWPRMRNRSSKYVGKRVESTWLSTAISSFGQHAKIIVNHRPVKYASAHDFRRTFGERWRRRGLLPIDLMELMRHENIETTMAYYTEHNSRSTGKQLWEKFGPSGSNSGSSKDQANSQT